MIRPSSPGASLARFSGTSESISYPWRLLTGSAAVAEAPRLTSGAMPEKVIATTRVARSEGLVTEPMEGGIVMLDPESTATCA